MGNDRLQMGCRCGALSRRTALLEEQRLLLTDWACPMGNPMAGYRDEVRRPSFLGATCSACDVTMKS